MAYEWNTPYLIVLYGIVSEMSNIYKGWHNQVDQGKLTLRGHFWAVLISVKVMQILDLAAISI